MFSLLFVPLLCEFPIQTDISCKMPVLGEWLDSISEVFSILTDSILSMAILGISFSTVKAALMLSAIALLFFTLY